MRYEGIREVNALPTTGNNYDIYLLKNADGTATPYAFKDGSFVEVPLGSGGGGSSSGDVVVNVTATWDTSSYDWDIVADKTFEEIRDASNAHKKVTAIVDFSEEVDNDGDVTTTHRTYILPLTFDEHNDIDSVEYGEVTYDLIGFASGNAHYDSYDFVYGSTSDVPTISLIVVDNGIDVEWYFDDRVHVGVM